MSHFNMLTPPSSSEDSPQCYITNDTMVYSETNFVNFEENHIGPYLRIVEEPIDKFRFRYKSEMTGTHGSLCGETSDRSRKQRFPTVELCNFDKEAVVRCSIYQSGARDDFMPHAHRLVRKQGKDEVDDPHDAVVNPQVGFIHEFQHMGIIHTAKKNVVPELKRKIRQLKQEDVNRKEIRPLQKNEEIIISGMAEEQSRFINLNIVCLRFDAFKKSEKGVLTPLCKPVYTHTINNLKSALTGELKIVRMDHCHSPVKGNREVFILVERVTKKNVRIRFFELDDNDQEIWENYGKFSDLDVHHQYAIVFKTPPYRDLDIRSPVKVFIQLERPSDMARSDPKEFIYTPNSDAYQPGSKRPCNWSDSYGTSSNAFESVADIPLPINELNLAGEIVSSIDLEEAKHNINSDEFNTMFNEHLGAYLSSSSSSSNVVDAAPRMEGVIEPQMELERRILQPQMDTAKPIVVAQSGPSVTVGNFSRSWRVQNVSMNYTPQMERVKVLKGDLGAKVLRPISWHPRPTDSEIVEAERAIAAMQNTIRSNPRDVGKARELLHRHLSPPNKTNALHVSIKQNDRKSVDFLLKSIYLYKEFDLVNVTNKDGETPLQIATYNKIETSIQSLLACNADVTITDRKGNTPLHIAVISKAPVPIMEILLNETIKRESIHLENNEGDTALNLAIEYDNMAAFRLLCLKGANLNLKHMKSGYTPLRFAVERQNLHQIEFLLSCSQIDPVAADFKGVTPLQAALSKDNAELVALVKEYMRENNIPDMDIKSEVEDPISDEEAEEKYSPTARQLLKGDNLKAMYAKVSSFDEECLDEIGEILDNSGTWQNLADLLDLGHLLRSGLCDPAKGSPTKMLLKVATETNGDTVHQIRDFLEILDEKDAVELIDDMVKKQVMR